MTAWFDAGLSILIAIFVYLGHRWAILVAMAWWTLEKTLSLVDLEHLNAGAAISQLVWWCVYMHAFWLAFRVERERRKPRIAAVFD